MYKAIFIDIDGTLSNNKKIISERTIEAIKKVTEKGILIILCSGRTRKYTENVSKKCMASEYIISSNGGTVYNYKEKKILYSIPIKKEALIRLYEIANTNDVRFIMDAGETNIVNKYKKGTEDEILISNILNDDDSILNNKSQNIRNIEKLLNKNEIVQCIIADSNFDKIKNIVPEIEKISDIEIKNRHRSLFDPNFPKDNTIYCDIANAQTSKGNAIEKLCNILNIDISETIGIGDSINDLSMFQKVGYKVAVENAIQVLKQAADKIINSNENDGVAIFLEEVMLKEIS